MQVPIKVLALDVEGTLISNAMSQFPRPGLKAFLAFCQQVFPEVVLFTAVSEPRTLKCMQTLVEEGSVEPEVASIVYIPWEGPKKDLSFVQKLYPDASLEEILIVDDLEEYIVPEQRSQWVPIESWVSPYVDTDRELERIQGVLRGYASMKEG